MNFQNADLINAKLNNIENLLVKWGEAAGPFLSIESLMRYIAELHKPLQTKITELIKTDKSSRNNQYVHYWDCNPKYLTSAIESIFGNHIAPETVIQIRKYPDLRDKFLHGNFISLMKIMGIAKSLEPGEIYRSFLIMERNDVFGKLRLYSAEVSGVLKKVIRSLSV